MRSSEDGDRQGFRPDHLLHHPEYGGAARPDRVPQGEEIGRRANEYKVYDELNNRFFEYQKIALEYYDLDILDVPNNDPSLAFDKKRKQEMVAHAILFSLFERAFLMFYQQEDQFRLRQWSGWKHFLNDFIRRESVRTAWRLSRETYDTDFQKFMDGKIAEIQSTTPPAALLEKVSTPIIPLWGSATPVEEPSRCMNREQRRASESATTDCVKSYARVASWT